MKIIIVDDHRIIRESLSDLLSKQGFNIIGTASNGRIFLELLEKEMPDVVVMDIAMPEMDGHEATIKAIAKYPEQKYWFYPH